VDFGARTEGGPALAVIGIEDDIPGYQIPLGATAQVAIYTEHWHHVSPLRKPPAAHGQLGLRLPRGVLRSAPVGRAQVCTCGCGPSLTVLRSTSKITAVDQPNSSTPFIAVIGPSSRQRSNGVTSP
jgi:hypothetical protein